MSDPPGAQIVIFREVVSSLFEEHDTAGHDHPRTVARIVWAGDAADRLAAAVPDKRDVLAGIRARLADLAAEEGP